MINLLSDEKKSEIRAGRTNVILLRYIIMTSSAIALLIVILVGTYFALSISRAGAQARVDDNEAQRSSYSQSVSDAQAFRSNLATAKTILDKEISYSTAVLKIANSIPEGVVIDDITLSPETIGSPTKFTAQAKSKDAALDLKTSLENNTELFSNVQIDTINFASEGDDDYPVDITLSLTINKAALQ